MAGVSELQLALRCRNAPYAASLGFPRYRAQMAPEPSVVTAGAWRWPARTSLIRAAPEGKTTIENRSLLNLPMGLTAAAGAPEGRVAQFLRKVARSMFGPSSLHSVPSGGAPVTSVAGGDECFLVPLPMLLSVTIASIFIPHLETCRYSFCPSGCL